MKNFLKTSLYLATFVLAGIMFQISCSNTENETSSTASTSIGKLIYVKQAINGIGGVTLWTCNYDGTNATQIPVALPSNLAFSSINGDARPRLSPDGQKVFFLLSDFNDEYITTSIYSCDIDGQNLHEIMSATNTETYYLGGAY